MKVRVNSNHLSLLSWLTMDHPVSNSIVAYLRLLTSAEIRVNPDNYAGFLFHPETMDPMDVGDFCSAFVESIGKEAGACICYSALVEHY